MALTKIVTNAITDDAITAAKIADGTIVAADLAANSVDSSELNGLVVIQVHFQQMQNNIFYWNTLILNLLNYKYRWKL